MSRLHQWEGEPSFKRSLPEIGRLKVGVKNERGVPTSLDYFRITGKYGALVEAIHGKRPTSIPIFFISDDTDHVCNLRYRLIASQKGKGARMYAEGDGRNFRVFNGKELAPVEVSGREEMESQMAKWAAKFKGEWKKTLTLRFLIQELKATIGEWVFETSAETSIANIVGPFDLTMRGAGTVRMVPFTLRVQMHTKFSASEHNQAFPIVSLVPMLGEDHLESLRLHQNEIFSNVGVKVLSGEVIQNSVKQIGGQTYTPIEGGAEIEEVEWDDVPAEDHQQLKATVLAAVDRATTLDALVKIWEGQVVPNMLAGDSEVTERFTSRKNYLKK